MSEIRFDVVGLGNAIVDVMSKTDDAFLDHWGIHKNAMNLIEEDRAHALEARGVAGAPRAERDGDAARGAGRAPGQDRRARRVP